MLRNDGVTFWVEGNRASLQPGMTATIEIRTGSNTVLKYLLKPIVKTLDESLSER